MTTLVTTLRILFSTHMLDVAATHGLIEGTQSLRKGPPKEVTHGFAIEGGTQSLMKGPLPESGTHSSAKNLRQDKTLGLTRVTTLAPYVAEVVAPIYIRRPSLL